MRLRIAVIAKSWLFDGDWYDSNSSHNNFFITNVPFFILQIKLHQKKRSFFLKKTVTKILQEMQLRKFNAAEKSFCCNKNCAICLEELENGTEDGQVHFFHFWFIM